MLMQVLAQAALVAVAGGILWALCKPNYTFVVRIRDGKPHVVRGKVAGGFLRDLETVCEREEIANAVVRGVRRDGRMSLRFSGVPEECRQQIRNAWSFWE